MPETSEYISFGVGDFVVFFGMLAMAMLIGIYHAVKDRNKETMDTYYFGGKNMSPIPVGLSISVTWISAITIITFPAETYLFGMVNAWYCFCPILPNVIHCLFYIPLVHDLKLSSVYEYLERRFDHRIRKLGSLMMCAVMIFFMAITIYIPALALSAVTPMSIILTIVITGATCTFYTTLGGMKAVVWTDALQTFIMLAGCLAVLIKATMVVGGVGNVMSALERGSRLNFWNFNPDPTVRNSFWTIILGCAVTWSTPNQAIIQRYLSCRNTKIARQAVIVSVFPSMIFISIAICSGAAMYAYFETCDPLMSKKIEKPDQIMPYMVLELFQDLPGMAGLFVAAAFSATLSTVSSGINSISSMLMEDLVMPLRPKLSPALKLTISKVLVFLFGVTVTSFAMAVMTIEGTVFQIAYTFFGVVGGPLVGVFALGMFLPWSNAKGAIFGQFVSTILTGWIAFSGFLHGKSPSENRTLPASADGCLHFGNATASTTVSTFTTETVAESYGIESTLYAVSFLYYGTISLISTVVFGLIGSFVTGATKASDADPMLFIPIISHRIFPAKLRKIFRFGVPEKWDSDIECKTVDSAENEGLVSTNDVKRSNNEIKL